MLSLYTVLIYQHIFVYTDIDVRWEKITFNCSYDHGLYRTITVTDSKSSETEYLSVCQSYDVSDGFHRVPFSAHRLVYGSDGQVVDTDMLVGQLFRLPLLILKRVGTNCYIDNITIISIAC